MQFAAGAGPADRGDDCGLRQRPPRRCGPAGGDPYQHFLTYGWKLGRNPDAFFGVTATKTPIPTSGMPVSIRCCIVTSTAGKSRNPSIGFDTNFYLAHNADVKAAGVDPLVHYLQLGDAEGRLIEPAVGPNVNSVNFDPT